MLLLQIPQIHRGQLDTEADITTHLGKRSHNIATLLNQKEIEKKAPGMIGFSGGISHHQSLTLQASSSLEHHEKDKVSHGNLLGDILLASKVQNQEENAFIPGLSVSANHFIGVDKTGSGDICGILSSFLNPNSSSQSTKLYEFNKDAHSKNHFLTETLLSDNAKVDKISDTIAKLQKNLNNKLDTEDFEENEGSQSAQFGNHTSFNKALNEQFGLTADETIETIENLLAHLSNDISYSIIEHNEQDTDKIPQSDSYAGGMDLSSRLDLGKLVEVIFYLLWDVREDLNDGDRDVISEEDQNTESDDENVAQRLALVARFAPTTSEIFETIEFLLDHIYIEFTNQIFATEEEDQDTASKSQSKDIPHSCGSPLEGLINTIKTLLKDLELQLIGDDVDSDEDGSTHINGSLSGEVSLDDDFALCLREIIQTTEKLVIFFGTELFDLSAGFVELGATMIFPNPYVARNWLNAISELIKLFGKIRSLPANLENQLSSGLEIGIDTESDTLVDEYGLKYRREIIESIKSLLKYLNSELVHEIILISERRGEILQNQSLKAGSGTNLGIVLHDIIETIKVLFGGLEIIDGEAEKILKYNTNQTAIALD
ncbi:hypothetical protein QAD02_014539 [Eretmocerus hayati]|uniref:Uncharacterized protein n=1 Tax=Eretmocerus hayati TaxID=131215 RepID=A0ACC2P5U1_9HYME|nr:hypothetical protein QAD02_014539 [Eretmocerus hayati]